MLRLDALGWLHAQRTNALARAAVAVGHIEDQEFESQTGGGP
jgi:hypothetical protein